MKKILLPLLMVSMGIHSHAQQDIFALTGKETTQISFEDFRSLDPKAGTSGNILLNSQTPIKVFSQNLNEAFLESKSSIHNAQTPNIAALAFDATGNDLVYVPMFSSNLYVLDAATKKVTLVENTTIKSTTCDIASHITRMTTGADGNIYALTNSGSQFIQISKKNGKYTVTDLGKISDVSNNAQNSLNVIQLGFGGDMVADADGNFYVFSASGNVFKISLKNLTSELVGKITGLPENYSLNGAAVDETGKVMIASAKGDVFYEVNVDNLVAKPLQNDLKLHIYDLASKYLVHDNSRVVQNNNFEGFDIYPTKVDQSFVNVRVANHYKGKIVFELYDSIGTKVLSTTITNSSDRNNVQTIQLNKLKSGLYIANIKDESGNQILSKKILVQ